MNNIKQKSPYLKKNTKKKMQRRKKKDYGVSQYYIPMGKNKLQINTHSVLEN
jgi:hypothetical protein